MLTRQISFPVNKYLVRVMNSKLFPNLGVLSAFYFLMVFMISFILWIPVGGVIGIILVTLAYVLEESGLATSSVLIQKSYPFFFIGILILTTSSIFFFIIKKFNDLRKKKLSPNVLKLITLIATTISYFYFIYLIRDWWFLN